MSYLIVRNTAGQEYRIPLTGPMVLGRSPKCGLHLQDPALSREHCRIESSGNGWMVVDLNSRNGTYIGMDAVARHMLSDGDVIRIGDHQISYKTGAIKPGRAADPGEDQHARLMAANKKQNDPEPATRLPQPRPKSFPQPVPMQVEPGEDEIVSPYGLPFTRPRPRPIVKDS